MRNYIFKVLLLTVVSVFIVPQKIYSQDYHESDSLFYELYERPYDTNLIKSIGEHTWSILFGDPERAIFETSRLIPFAEHVDLGCCIYRVYQTRGIAYDMTGQYDSALYYYNKALDKALLLNLKLEEGDIYNLFGITYSYMGLLEKSIEYSLKALEIFESEKDSSRMAKVYNNLGSRYSEMDLDGEALEYYFKASEINLRKEDHRRLAKNYGNIGTVYSSQNEHDKALEYYSKALGIQQELQNTHDLSITFTNMAISYQRKEKFDSAFHFANKALIMAVGANDGIGILTYLTTTAAMYRDMGDYHNSLVRYDEAENYADSIGARQNLAQIYNEKSELYAEMGDYQNAYRYKDKFNQERSTLLDSEKDKALNKIKTYEEIKQKNAIELLTKDAEIQNLKLKRQKIIRNSVSIVGALILIMAFGIWRRYIYIRKTRNELALKNAMIQKEKDKSDGLLLNILPEETAEELKTQGTSKARHFDKVTVMFTDFKEFTKMAETLSAQKLVEEVDYCFKAFDQIISKHNIEKIKTIGDAYMCAGGLPIANETNPVDVVNAALEILNFMLDLKKTRNQEGNPCFEIRVGIHTGPVVAGIVGTKKFAYDIWGDTVNIASRMESSGEVGSINVSGDTYELIKNYFTCTYRGKIEAKNKGAIDMYFVDGPQEETS